MGFEVDHRLNFAVSRNQAANRAAFDRRRADADRSFAGEYGNQRGGYDYAGGYPSPGLAGWWGSVRIVVVRGQPVFFQGATAIRASSNLPPRGGGNEYQLLWLVSG